MAEAGVVRVSAVVLRNEAGAVLTVRKLGTDRFMLPGGKPEPGERPQDTAVRECREELGVELTIEAMRSVGKFRATAANEPGFEVEGTIFEHPAPIDIAPSAEITELRWLDPDARPLPDDLAPLLAEQVLPAIGMPTEQPAAGDA